MLSPTGRTFVVAVVALSAGCASQLLSDERLATNTAGAIGVAPGDVVVSNRREQLPNTFYTAKTKAGKEYNCTVNGGSLLAAGMVNPPSCSPK